MKALSLSLCLFLGSCADPDFPRVEVLDTFRVLGLATTTPEVTGAASVDVFPFVTDPNGNGRTVSGTYEYCVDPGVSFGAPPSCRDVPGAVTGSYSINFTADSDFAANGYTGLATTPVTVMVPANLLSGRSSREQFNGVAMIVVLRFEVDGREVSAFRRIAVTNRGSTNVNPAAPVSILLNGTPIGAQKPSKNDELSIDPLNDEEVFQVQTVDGTIETRTESYEVAYFISRGELDRSKASVGESVKFLEPAASASSFTAVVMVRDERGGLSFVREFIP